MRHSAAGPSGANKSNTSATDPGKATPAGFAKGADGKWIKPGGDTTFTRTGTAATKAAPATQHFNIEGGAKPVAKPAAAAVKEFEGAGANLGIQIWRIEKLKVAPVNPAEYGKFFSGDSYIVLNTYTAPNSNSRKYDLHFWLGESTSQDEAGVAAYKTIELDDKLGGIPVQHREVQSHESGLFLSYFKGGIEYMEGGIDSGFRKVDRDAHTNRLLQLKGKRNVRVKEVPMKVASLNKGDVFVLDAGKVIYQWNGPEASRNEKAKGLEVTRNINNNERGAKSRIAIIEYPSDNDGPDAKEFWKLLGGESTVAEAAAGGDDAAEEASAQREIALFRVSDASGQLEVSPIEERPITKSHLDGNDCFILDVGNSVFVWVGKGSTQQEKQSSMQFASQYLSQAGKPDWTPITRVVEGAETSAFKSNFAQWTEPKKAAAPSAGTPGNRPGQLTKQNSKVDTNAMHTSQRNLAAESKDKFVHSGRGTLTVWRVEDFKRAEIPKDQYGIFYGGDSYVILYSEKREGGNDLNYIYFWQGRTSSTDEKGASALLAKEVDDSLNGRGIQVRVVQNKEPDHFLSLFKGGILVKQGGHPSGFHSVTEVAKPTDEHPVNLFHVKGSSGNATRALEVEASAASLNSGDAFVVLSKDSGAYVWYGSGCSSDEKTVAKTTAERLSGAAKEVQEGKEDATFWNLLGGKQEYAKNSEDETAREPRLFWGSNATGEFKIEELYNFTQDDLADDDVYILDCFNEVYVWVGAGSNDVEKKTALETAVEYVKNAPDGRSADTNIVRVSAGSEPPMFTCHFAGWDDSGVDVYTRKLRQLKLAEEGGAGTASVKDDLKGYETKESYTYAELVARPKNVDMAQADKYLAANEFQTVFGMTRDAFNALPAWKRTDLKKQKKLF